MLELVTSSWSEGVNDSATSRDLHILLCIDDIWHNAAVACIEHIQNRNIAGHLAVSCISEIRLAINRITHPVSWDESFLSGTDVSSHLHKIGQACIVPLLDDTPQDAKLFSIGIELLPTLVNALDVLQRQFSGCSLSTDADGNFGPLDWIFALSWSRTHLLAIASILCELYPFLTEKQLDEFQVSVSKNSCHL